MKRYNLYFTLLIVNLLLASCVQENAKNISSSEYSGDIERTYVAPVRVVRHNAQVKDVNVLLKEGKHQAQTVNTGLCYLSNNGEQKGQIILDYGKELHGGIEIVTGMWKSHKPLRVRIRLGESVSEALSDIDGDGGATNDHAIRDWVQLLPWCGKIEIGNSAFRFVTIDFLDDHDVLALREVNAISIEREIEYLGSFKCNDDRLNDIWMTGARTVHLNMQEYLWDAPKRDRLVWVGDMHPEVMTILAVFGGNEVVPKSLDFIKDITPLPEWMNGISSYSMWWLLIQHQWYLNTGDISQLEKHKDYISQLLRHLATKVDDSGKEQLNGVRFLDWPTKADPVAVHAGLQSMMAMTFDVGEKLSQILNKEDDAIFCESMAQRVRLHIPDMPTRKSPAALMSLAGLADAKQVNDAMLMKDGVYDLSTFYGYYVLLAMAQADNYQGALDFISEYWGAMLDLGATSFWEDFDITWMENAARIDELVPDGKVDVHRRYGGYCYKGLRHSFCHGWASGPTAWLSQYVLGVNVVEPGCKVLKIEPHLGDLQWVEGTYPTPMGVVKIKHVKGVDGKVKSEIDAPRGVRIISE